MVKSKKISDSGEARAPGPSLREHLLADGSGVSPPLLEESYVFLGSEDISCLLYTSPSPRDLSTSRMPSSA